MAKSPMDSETSATVVHVIGLQRSGTNFINKLLEINTNAVVLPSGNRSVCWKHSLPSEAGRGHTTSAQLSAAAAIRNRPRLRVLLVSKQPLTWWESVSTRAGRIFLINRPMCKTADGKADLASCCTFYNLYYKSWLKLADSKQVWHVRYEDALRDAVKFTTDIAENLQLRMNPTFSEPEQVPYSRGFNSARRDYYLEARVRVSESQWRLFDEIIDRALLASLGYQMPDRSQRRAGVDLDNRVSRSLQTSSTAGVLNSL